MQKILFTTAILICLLGINPATILAQLPELVLQANEQFSAIETDKEIITQELVMSEDQPYNVELIRATEKIKDGKIKTERFLFNIALLDDKRVEIKSSKSKMLLKMETRSGKYIQRFEDDEAKGYTNVLEIQFTDIDEARSAQSTWEALIPMAKTEWTQAINLPQSLGDLKKWLQPYVVDVDMGKHVASQSLTESTVYEDYVIYEVSNIKGKDSRIIYRFSLSDIDDKSIKVGPSGSVIKLDMRTENNKKLILTEDDDGISFQNKLSIYFSDAGSALEMSKGMEVVTSMAQLAADARNKSYETCIDCLSDYTGVINSYKGDKISTSLEGECRSILKMNTGKKEESYEFRWADLDVRQIEQDYGTNELTLQLQTIGKKKFVTRKEGDEVKGYENNIEFYFDDLETFRKSAIQVESIIESCNVDLSPESIEWLDGIFSSQQMEKMDQSIALEETCSLIYISSERDGDKSDSFEFNLYDLDPKRIDMNISRSKLQLKLNTNKKEKIITKTNQDGKLEYTNSLTLSFNSLDNLRIAEFTIMELIEGCSQN